MKLTNVEILKLFEGLNKLRGDRSQVLPIKAGFAIVKDIKILEPIYTSIITMRDELVRTYGEQKDDGSIAIPPDKVQQTNEELSKLSEIENEVELDILPLSMLQDLSFTLEEIDVLYPIINSEA